MSAYIRKPFGLSIAVRMKKMKAASFPDEAAIVFRKLYGSFNHEHSRVSM
jgi:hypothetical protein